MPTGLAYTVLNFRAGLAGTVLVEGYDSAPAAAPYYLKVMNPGDAMTELSGYWVYSSVAQTKVIGNC
jgi:hypothetical protein